MEKEQLLGYLLKRLTDEYEYSVIEGKDRVIVIKPKVE